MPQLLDAGRLLDFVQPHTEAKSVLVQAIYSGLEQRITRGDFNATTDPLKKNGPARRANDATGPQTDPLTEGGPS